MTRIQLLRGRAQADGGIPLSFMVRHGDRSFVFWREPDAATGDRPPVYEVFALELWSDRASRGGWDHCLGEGRRLGMVAVDALRFENRGGPRVDSASLSRALDALLGAPGPEECGPEVAAAIDPSARPSSGGASS
jgi:hypothetical protein